MKKITIVLAYLLSGYILKAQDLDIASNVHRILFLGNSITWAGNYTVDIEAWITVHYPERHFEFIDAGLPSETVSGLSEEGHAGGLFPRPDLHERLQRVLDQTMPDLVFACYGMNDGIYKPFDEDRFRKFRDGIQWLHDAVTRTGARLIHVTPPVYDEHIAGNVGYASVLDKYSDWLLDQRASKKWEVVDVHYPMQQYLKAHREVDARYEVDGFALSADGIHPNEAGHWIMARELLRYLGCSRAVHCPSIAQEMATIPQGPAILRLVTRRAMMMRDAWLTATKYKRPGLPVGLPLDEAIARSNRWHREIDALVKGQPVTRIACVGEGTGDRVRGYPELLERMLGKGYFVDIYRTVEDYPAALQSLPNIVLIDPGAVDCRELVRSFKGLPSHPRIVLLLPLPGMVNDTAILPHIRQLAYDEKVEVLDLHSWFIDKEGTTNGADRLADDAQRLAKRLDALLTLKTDTAFNIFERLGVPYSVTSFYGYACAGFSFRGRDCKIVQPKYAAAGHPWVWRARFWGHEPQTDIALLERGYHIVYCDVAELFGNKEAIGDWNAFYALVHGAGLAEKAVMEGMSRGGVYVLNWAAVNAGKVSCVYLDNPVLDLKSWPGGMGRYPASVADRSALMADYHLRDSNALKRFKGSPIDKVEQIAKGHYPILILCADADEVVAPEENTLLFQQRMQRAGAQVTVMHKPGFHHHPHSLPDPEPIVDFVLAHSGR